MGAAFKAISTIALFGAVVAAVVFTFGIGIGFTAGFAARVGATVAGVAL